MKKRKKLSDDEKLRRYGVRLQKSADKALAEGRTTYVDYRDISWNALLMMRPRDCVRITGI